MRTYLELWLGGMFLQEQSYAYQRDRKNPFGHGLLYIVVIGVIIALAAIVGAGIRYAASPSADAIKNVVLVHLQAMPFYEQMPLQAQESFHNTYQQVWDQAGSLFVGYPTNPAGWATLLVGIITTPLGFVIGWLIYGALVHLVARGWNPETSYAELLAPLALAYSPLLLNVLTLFPEASISSQVTGLWTLILSIFAVKVAYKTPTRRAVWGALFPILVFALLLILLLGCALFSLLSVIGQMGGGSQ